MDHYSGYCYARLMRGTSAEEILWEKEVYERLKDTYGDRVFAYREDNGRLPDPLFKEEVQTCGQQIKYCGVRSHHQNEIVERIIKELTLGSWNLLLHATILWPEELSTMMCTFSSKATLNRYNSMKMDGDGKTPEQKFSGVKFQIWPTD